MAAKKKAVKKTSKKKTVKKKAVKKVVKKKTVKKTVSKKPKEESADLYVWLALIGMLLLIPIANSFIVPVLAIVALKNAKKTSNPLIVYILGIIALLIWIVQITFSTIFFIASMSGYY